MAAKKTKPLLGKLHSVEFNFPVGRIMNEVVFIPKGSGLINGLYCRSIFEVRVITRFGTNVITTNSSPTITSATRFIKKALKEGK